MNTREFVIRLQRDHRIDALNYLNNQPMNAAQAKSRRRASIASTSLFNIDNNVREAGYDRFEKIPRSKAVNIGKDDDGKADRFAVNAVNFGASTSGTATVSPQSNSGVNQTVSTQNDAGLFKFECFYFRCNLLNICKLFFLIH